MRLPPIPITSRVYEDIEVQSPITGVKMHAKAAAGTSSTRSAGKEVPLFERIFGLVGDFQVRVGQERAPTVMMVGRW